VLTLFTVAKPFRGEFATIQRNAILSWRLLRPACEILLLGDEEGIREMTVEVGAIHVSRVERNEFGTPLVSSIFSEAQRHASFPLLCYINADIILLNDFLTAIQKITEWNPASLIVGRRWDLELDESLAWEPNWEDSLRTRIGSAAELHPHTGLDYFVFPRGLWGQLPPLAIGRGLWDGWLVYRARELGVPVVDATEYLTAIHQNHDYSHHPGGEAGVLWGTETQRNYSIGGGLRHAFTLRDATHRLTRKGVHRRPVPFDLRRSLVVPVITQKWAKPLVWLKKALAQGVRP
jgi:hypothetical protein